MVITIRNVNINATGVATSLTDVMCHAIIDTTGLGDIASVEGVLESGTWGTAVIAIRKSNQRTGPFNDYSTATTLVTGNRMTKPLAIGSQYLIADITTPEGGAGAITLNFYFRPGDIGSGLVI